MICPPPLHAVPTVRMTVPAMDCPRFGVSVHLICHVQPPSVLRWKPDTFVTEIVPLNLNAAPDTW